MKLFTKNTTEDDKPKIDEICLDFESEVEKTMFYLLTDNILRHGTHVAVSSLIDGDGITRVGFRPVTLQGGG